MPTTCGPQPRSLRDQLGKCLTWILGQIVDSEKAKASLSTRTRAITDECEGQIQKQMCTVKVSFDCAQNTVEVKNYILRVYVEIVRCILHKLDSK